MEPALILLACDCQLVSCFAHTYMGQLLLMLLLSSSSSLLVLVLVLVLVLMVVVVVVVVDVYQQRSSPHFAAAVLLLQLAEEDWGSLKGHFTQNLAGRLAAMNPEVRIARTRPLSQEV